MEENRCVVCGDVIPEGREICPNCEKQYLSEEEPEPRYLGDGIDEDKDV